MSEAALRVLRAIDAILRPFYLDERVWVVEDLGGGWILCEWPDGRLWRHWQEQLRLTPFGDRWPDRSGSPAENEAV